MKNHFFINCFVVDALLNDNVCPKEDYRASSGA